MNTKIVWRLKERPTPMEVRDLLVAGIINKEESRQILFSEETEEDRKKESLEEEIKFLRQLLQIISSGNNAKIVQIIQEVVTPRHTQSSWYGPYSIWCSNATGLGNGEVKTSLGGSTYANGNVSSVMNEVTDGSVALAFSNIKTF